MPSAARLRGLGRLAFYEVQHFKREVVVAGGELANGTDDQVIGNDGWNGCSQACCGRDQGFGNSGSYGAQGGCASGSESVEGVNDAPDGSEESYERSDCASYREPRNVALKTRDPFRRGDLHRTLDGGKI